jgi:hypothetical protein
MTRTLLGIALFGLSAAAAATGRNALYEVTITNLTKGQTFTPQLVVTHSAAVQLFTPGEPASEELATLAEDGATGPLTALLEGAGDAVGDVQTIAGLLPPGGSATVRVEAGPRHRFLSAAGMLIPTNDTFFALDKERLPVSGQVTYLVAAYDAGSEANDQDCANIPGPRCGGVGSSPGDNAGDEGFVHIGNGFHELGDAGAGGGEVLGPQAYDWRNPVGMIEVRRIR